MSSVASVVLTMVSDPSSAASVDRIAAAVGARPMPAENPSRRAWLGAVAIVVDEPAALNCARLGLPRRDGIVLVSPGDPPVTAWAAAIGVGARQLCALPSQENELVRLLAEATESASVTGRSGPVIAVTGGRGGGGASVFAAALASCVDDSLLVDLDPCGGGIDLLLGAEDVPGLRWPELGPRSGRLAWSAVRDALPRRAGVSVLSGSRLFHEIEPGAVVAILEAARRAGPTVVCDVPRQLTPAGAQAVQCADLLVIVTSCDVRGIAAVGASLSVLRPLNPAAGLVVRGPAPGGLAAREVAEATGVPLLASMRPEPLLDQRLQRGGLRLRRGSPLAQAAHAVIGVVHRSGAARAA
jgi:secretion/DNA translocation related CpaE-like protein